MFSTICSDSEVQSLIDEHSDKAAGYPWNNRGTSTKGEAFRKYGLTEVENYYRSFSSVLSCTLKDELRSLGKDARLFRPQDLSSYVEGARLFLHQNAYLTTPFASPIFNKFITPGTDIRDVYTLLDSFSSGTAFGADGSQWDAHYPLDIAYVVCLFRSQFTDAARVRRYYQMMYNGWTNVFGNAMHLVGNPSGHFNTSTDNSLCHCVLIALTAKRVGIPYTEIDNHVRYFCCGDDLLWAAKIWAFYPDALYESYRNYGVTLEFEYEEPHPVTDLHFVGMKPCFRTVNGVRMLMYHMRPDHAHATALAVKKKRTPVMQLAKLSSLCHLTFADEVLFKQYRDLYLHALSSYVEQGKLSGREPDVIGQLRSIDEGKLLRQYTGWES